MGNGNVIRELFHARIWLICFVFVCFGGFHSYGDVTITGEGLQILTFARHSWSLSSEGSLSCHTYCDTGHLFINLTEVRPLFTLSHRGSDNSPLLIVFSANYIDQSNRNFMCLKIFRKFWHFDLLNLKKTTCPKWHENVNFIIFKNTAMRLIYAIWLVKIMTQSPTTKFTQRSLKHN